MENHHDLPPKSPGQSVEEESYQIGSRIRSVRKQEGLTIRALAERCQLSPNTLSLIENDRTSPSIRTLGRLAHGLGVSLTKFLEPETSGPGVVYQRHGQRQITKFDSGTIENLGDGMPPLGAEPILVTLGVDQVNPREISHTGREFVYCISGSVVCYIAGMSYPLNAGDSLLFDANLPHRWENDHAEPSQLLVLFCPLDEEDRPAELHLNKLLSTNAPD